MAHVVLHKILFDKMKEEIEAYLMSEDLEHGKALTEEQAEAFLTKHAEEIKGFASNMIRDYEADGELDELQTECQRDWFWEFFPEEFMKEMDEARIPAEQKAFIDQVNTAYQSASNGAMVLPYMYQTKFFNAMTAWMLEHMVSSVKGEDGVWKENEEMRSTILKAHEKWTGEEYPKEEEEEEDE